MDNLIGREICRAMPSPLLSVTLNIAIHRRGFQRNRNYFLKDCLSPPAPLSLSLFLSLQQKTPEGGSDPAGVLKRSYAKTFGSVADSL